MKRPGFREALRIAIVSRDSRIRPFMLADVTGLPARSFFHGRHHSDHKEAFGGQQHEYSDVDIAKPDLFVQWLETYRTLHDRDVNQQQRRHAVRAWQLADMLFAIRSMHTEGDCGAQVTIVDLDLMRLADWLKLHPKLRASLLTVHRIGGPQAVLEAATANDALCAFVRAQQPGHDRHEAPAPKAPRRSAARQQRPHGAAARP